MSPVDYIDRPLVNCTMSGDCEFHPRECATCAEREPVTCLSWDSCSPYFPDGVGAKDCLDCNHYVPDYAPTADDDEGQAS